MEGYWWIIISWVMLAAVYVIIFTQKRDRQRASSGFRRFDWIVLIIGVMGGVSLASAYEGTDFLRQPWVVLIVPALLLVLVVIAAIRRRKTGRQMVQQMGDERSGEILTKSSRNALFATYLTLFINSIVTDTNSLSNTWLVVMLGAGLLTLITSAIVYYYRPG